MNILANMLIAELVVPLETSAFMQYLVENPVLSYLQLGKAGEPNFHGTSPDVEPGRWLKVRDGKSRPALLSTSAGIQIAMDWSTNRKFEEFAVCSIPLWSMADKVAQATALWAHNENETVEDHL